MERVDVGGGEVAILATVQGLVAEAARVRDALSESAPAAVALGVSPESAATLLRYQPDPEVDLFDELPDHDFVYSAKLREFGDVSLPPPDLLEAARAGAEKGLPLYGVDLGEEAYEEAFLKEVGGLGFFRYGLVQKRLAKRPPRAKDARAFALAWDARVRKVGGLARMEARREAAIAEGAARLAREHGRVLLVVDVTREAGVLAHLRRAAGAR